MPSTFDPSPSRQSFCERCSSKVFEDFPSICGQFSELRKLTLRREWDFLLADISVYTRELETHATSRRLSGCSIGSSRIKLLATAEPAGGIISTTSPAVRTLRR